MPYEPWMDESRCADPSIDPDIFFSTDRVDIESAKKLCASCPVSMQCASYALCNGEREGIWSGMDMASLRQSARRAGSNVSRPRRTA